MNLIHYTDAVEMTPKLPTRPKFLDVRKGYEYVEPESKKLQPVFESIVENVKELERDRNELSNVRATLIVNFGPEGKSGMQCGVVIDKASEKGTLPLLVLVLEQLFEKAVKAAAVQAERKEGNTNG